MPNVVLNILFIEDSDDDVQLVVDMLEQRQYSVESVRVENAPGLQSALQSQSWDVIIADHKMPSFDSLSALKIVKDSPSREVPFLLVSGIIGEEAAVEAMRAGAHDYVMKSNLARLVPAIEREMREAANRRKQRELEARLPSLYLEAQEGIRMRDEFISVASHELRTPVTAMQLHLQTLRRDLQKPDAEKMAPEKFLPKVERAIEQLKKLSDLVENLLDISQLTAGGAIAQRETFDLTQVLREICERFNARAQTSAVLVTAQIASGLLCTGDREKIRQAISNVLANALKFGSDQPIALTAQSTGSRAVITVRDEGIGIKASDHERIFGSFERAVSPQHYGGLGLGLYVTRQIINAHGGKISVESEPGRGSTFTIELSLNAEKVASLDLATPTP